MDGETLIDSVCELQQRSRNEQGDEGETSDTLWLAVFRSGEDLRTGDAVMVDGDEYEMVGDPWSARSPFTGRESHVEATLRRTAGYEDAS